MSEKQFVSRALLKKAVDNQQWDLLDKLLEIDNQHINDTSLYTDTWGEWWGLLYECVQNNQPTGVRILLKHGAKRHQGNWGDCLPMSPLEYAQEKKFQEIMNLLIIKEKPTYQRQTEPEIPSLNAHDKKVNQQGKTRDETGLVFQIPEEDE